MKEWYNDIDSATLQRIKTYSAFNDAQSKNLMVQTMYEYREKEIQDFKETNHELALESIARQKRIVELEKENVELKESITKFSKNGLDFLHSMKSNRNCIDCESKMSIQLTKAKEIIKKFSEFANNEIEYDPEHPQEHTDLWNKLCAEAEQFLSEVKKNDSNN